MSPNLPTSKSPPGLSILCPPYPTLTQQQGRTPPWCQQRLSGEPEQLLPPGNTPLLLMEQCQRKLAKTENLNNIEFHNIVPKMSVSTEANSHTKNQENYKEKWKDVNSRGQMLSLSDKEFKAAINTSTSNYEHAWNEGKESLRKEITKWKFWNWKVQ